MPVNKSTSKVRVTKLFGAGATSGLADPKVHMQVKHGISDMWIKTLDSGNYQVGLALSSGGSVVAKSYPHDLSIDEDVAEYFGWPTADGSVTLGHSGVYEGGVPIGTNNKMVYMGGDGAAGVHTY